MKAISKSISYGYSKSVQLFFDEDLKSKSMVYILVIFERGVDGELLKVAESRYDDYFKAVFHLYNLIISFIYPDLFQS